MPGVERKCRLDDNHVPRPRCRPTMRNHRKERLSALHRGSPCANSTVLLWWNRGALALLSGALMAPARYSLERSVAFGGSPSPMAMSSLARAALRVLLKALAEASSVVSSCARLAVLGESITRVTCDGTCGVGIPSLARSTWVVRRSWPRVLRRRTADMGRVYPYWRSRYPSWEVKLEHHALGGLLPLGPFVRAAQVVMGFDFVSRAGVESLAGSAPHGTSCARRWLIPVAPAD